MSGPNKSVLGYLGQFHYCRKFSCWKITLKFILRGTWVAQSIKHPTLNLISDHDLRAVRSNPALGSTLHVEPA